MRIHFKIIIGWTALHLAVEADFFAAVRILISSGADVTKTEGTQGQTALHICIQKRLVRTADFLINEGEADLITFDATMGLQLLNWPRFWDVMKSQHL